MRKLIITENLKSIVEAGKVTLSRKNIKVFTASSAEEVLNIHRLENVNLIVTDLDIMSTSDDEICAALSNIREDAALKKVSIITVCDNDKAVIERCYACGANTFVAKPIDSVELLSKIIKFSNISDRASLRVILNVSIKGEHKDTDFFANSENISKTGLLFVTDEVLKKDDTIKCSFFVGGMLITTNGEITRVDKRAPGQIFYGLQFLELSPFSKNIIEKFIEEPIENS